MNEMKEILEKIAKEESWMDSEEDFNPYDMSGGNFDDAFWGGEDAGRISLARDLLERFFS